MYLDTTESAAARSAELPSASGWTAERPAPLAGDQASPTAHPGPLGEQPQRSEPTVRLGEQPQRSEPTVRLGEQPQGSQPGASLLSRDPQHSQIPEADSRGGSDLNARLAS